MAPSGQVVVFGGGGHARSVVDALRRAGGEVEVVVAPEADGIVEHHLTDDEAGLDLARGQAHPALVCLGDNVRRLQLVSRLVDAGVSAPAFVAVSATVAPTSRLGRGTVVLEHAHVGPGARLGDACIVNTGAVVEHDCLLGDGVHVAVAATLGGGVTCGNHVLIGAGATVLPGVSIGAGALVAAGAVVTADVPSAVTAKGIPARWQDGSDV